ncbi:carbamoyltransferase family protein [Streptomyces sp. NPDC054796]
MRVLGLNGWPGRGHDASACLVEDGRLIALAEEERFTRRKHAYGAAPVHAAAFCLDRAGITLDDVDAVAFGWDVPLLYRDRGIPYPFTDRTALELLLPARELPRRRDPQLVFVPHHVAHAASVFHLSRDKRAAILVVDGQGERESTSLAIGERGKISVIDSFPPAWSLGYFYDAVGRYIGLGPDQAGKTMGLAAYGRTGDASFGSFAMESDFAVAHLPADLMSRRNIDDSEEVIDGWLAHLERTCPLPPNTLRRRWDSRTARFSSVPDRDPFDYADIAATAQAAIEHLVSGFVDSVVRLTGEETLHVAGGVALNATLNGRLLHHPALRRVFVQPLAGDAGVALGAALHLCAEGGHPGVPMGAHLAWGPEFSPGAVRDVVTAGGLRFDEPGDLPSAVADLIADGRTVGWFQGRAEAGPRALGQRSILADPGARETRDRLNLRIKRREWWRPLAPSVTSEEAPAYLETPVPLPYMVTTVPLRPEARARFEAVDHVDGTTRAQTVEAAEQPLYHELLRRVGERSGASLLLNTSFNGNEEPLVNSPADALSAYARLGLDALAIGPFLLRKR